MRPIFRDRYAFLEDLESQKYYLQEGIEQAIAETAKRVSELEKENADIKKMNGLSKDEIDAVLYPLCVNHYDHPKNNSRQYYLNTMNAYRSKEVQGCLKE